MKILIFGGTRYMGRHAVQEFLRRGYEVTIATRGQTQDDFGNRVTRIIADRTSKSALEALPKNVEYDIVFDSQAYSSNEIKYLLDNVKCKRYVQISTASVYEKWHLDLAEERVNPLEKPVVWCNREDFEYGEVKRQAENAIFQSYGHIPSVSIRFPLVAGQDDYTKRLYFYVEHVVLGKPMLIDNLDSQIGFVRSDEAGQFLVHMGESDFTGVVNGASRGVISIGEIIDYASKKSGKAPIFSENGEPAPFNGASSYSLCVDRAEKLGFSFSKLDRWIYDLLDYFVEQSKSE